MTENTKDKGYQPWITVCVSFITQTIIYGLLWTVGIWNSVFIYEFEASSAKTSWTGSLLNAIAYLGGLFSSWLIFKFSCRQIVCLGGLLATVGVALSSIARSVTALYITFSIITGLGLGLAITPSIVIICDYFETKRALALGIASSGAGFGTFIFPTINEGLLNILHWRLALLAESAIVFLIFLSGMFMKPFPIKKENSFTDKKKDKRVFKKILHESKRSLSLLKIPSFLAFCFNNFMILFGYTMVIVHNIEFFKSLDFLEPYHIPVLATVIGICNLCGRIGLGIMCNYTKASVIYVYCVCNFLQGLSVFIMPLANQYYNLLICVSIFGFTSSCMGPLIPEVTIQIVGQDNIGVGYGFLLIFEGIGAMISPPLAGIIYDKRRKYDTSFYLGGGVSIGAGFVLGIVHIIAKSRKRKREERKSREKPPPITEIL